MEDYWARSGGLLAEWPLPPRAECFHSQLNVPVNGTVSLYTRGQALAGACGRQLHLAACLFYIVTQRARPPPAAHKHTSTGTILDLDLDLVLVEL